MVRVINPGDASSQIGSALSVARTFVNYTGGIAIIYFGEGKDSDSNFHNAGSIFHTFSDKFMNNSSGHWNNSVSSLFLSGIPP